jgi:redox-sensitive bicupin YhaK (pirin superfamily)
MSMTDPILAAIPLDAPWPTLDPFLMAVHHDDAYPRGNAAMGPDESLAGRDLGMDFSRKNGWSMYHGHVVPGFPRHPHRGFETVTIVRRGFIDHSDSLGATARYGQGDVQWLTAGRGISHCEMFPLLDEAAPNPAELFQIWLNLPHANKLVAPHFTMLWADRIPHVRDGGVDVAVISDALAQAAPLAPPPSSWAARTDADVAIWTLAFAAGARFTLPPAHAETNRVAYLFRGSARIADRVFDAKTGVQLRPDVPVPIEAPTQEAELLVLQGRPIGEPVVQHGPFVMTTREEIAQAFADYRRDEFGGWPWPTEDPVHPRDGGRFAKHADGRVEQVVRLRS